MILKLTQLTRLYQARKEAKIKTDKPLTQESKVKSDRIIMMLLFVAALLACIIYTAYAGA